jgi:hypothetical protein
MNKILVFICFLALTKAASAQKDSLAFDDHGKYIYYKVVNMDKYNADTLYRRSISFFKSNTNEQKDFKLTQQNDKTTSLSGTGFFIIYKPFMAKHSDGQISYTFTMEIKGSKYRYWLTSFLYTPYYRDRYNNYVPDKSIEVPLEKASKSISEKELAHYLDESALFARQLGERLKQALSKETAATKKEEPKKVIHIDKW